MKAYREIVVPREFDAEQRNINRIHRWLSLESNWTGGFTSKNGRYQGYKLFENESFVFVFFKYPQK